MAIPAYHEFYNLFLESLQDGQVHSIRECRQYIKQKLKFTNAELAEMTPSGLFKWIDRVGWCKTYLKKAGLIYSPKRACWALTSTGKELLVKNVQITNALLAEQSTGFRDFVKPQKKMNDVSMKLLEDEPISGETPQETFERVYKDINAELADELLAAIYDMSPQFFERLVVKLLEGMGYGGYEGAGFVTKSSHDNGIDGVIDEDKLGFNRIYIQAKKWAIERIIHKPDIQQFKGALDGPPKMEKGLYITTAQFSKGAKEYAEAHHIILVDGKKLAELMIEFDVGVSTQKAYKIKRIDSDFFNEDE